MCESYASATSLELGTASSSHRRKRVVARRWRRRARRSAVGATGTAAPDFYAAAATAGCAVESSTVATAHGTAKVGIVKGVTCFVVVAAAAAAGAHFSLSLSLLRHRSGRGAAAAAGVRSGFLESHFPAAGAAGAAATTSTAAIPTAGSSCIVLSVLSRLLQSYLPRFPGDVVARRRLRWAAALQQHTFAEQCELIGLDGSAWWYLKQTARKKMVKLTVMPRNTGHRVS